MRSPGPGKMQSSEKYSNIHPLGQNWLLTENNLAGALSQIFSWRGVGSRGLVMAEIELADEFIKNKHETGADVIARASDIKTSLRGEA